MQRSIESFFKIAPKKKEESEPAITKKRKARIISSDEDEIPESPEVAKSREHKKSRRIAEKSPRTYGDIKKPSLSKLKTTPNKKSLKSIDPASLFGGETLRVEAKKPPRPKQIEVIELDDDEIDKSLMEVNIDEQISNKNIKLNPEREKQEKKHLHSAPKKLNLTSQKETKKTPSKDKYSVDDHTPPSTKKARGDAVGTSITDTQKKLHHEEKRDRSLSPSNIASSKSHRPKEEKKTPKSVPKTHVTPKVQKHADLESSVLSDEERHERKRMAAVLYQKFKNRSSCINPGSKEVPKGKQNCLAGRSFLVTGVLESLERDEAASIIKEYGGKIMTTVGKSLDYLIVGEEAGPKKLAQAEEFGIKIISEDDLFELIRGKGKEEKVKIKKEKSKSPMKRQEHEVNGESKGNIAEENGANKSKLTKLTHQDKPSVSENMIAWVDKYKPSNVKEIIGQHGAASNVAKLTNWLSKWYINHDGSKKLQKPNPWAKNDDGSYYKAALLSGPPGIGKTTTATLVCKELGFDAIEFNASDTRSKRLLKEEVAELLSNKTLYGYFHGDSQAFSKKHVLIMDEVDGMAGNEDRGGIQELIGLIKESSVPIICICNDRNHQKMRSLVTYCYDIRFNRPRIEQIKSRILSICFKEKYKIDPAKVEEIVAATNHDIRQSINHISLLSAGKELQLKSNGSEKTAEKDMKLGPWEVVRKVFSIDEHKNMSFNDKCDLFFHDYSLSPLFVQQNYLQVSPEGPRSSLMAKVALTADALSLGDLVDKLIRSSSAWSLLPLQAVFSSVMPGEYMRGRFIGQINFPGWLGKNSRSNKRNRLAQEIHDHTRLRTSGSRLSIRLDYAPFMLSKIVHPLLETNGIERSLDVLKEYHLLREDVDSLIEITTWSGKKGIMDAVDGRVKAALTRAYNKEVLAYSYSVTAGVKKKKAVETAYHDELMEVEEVEEEVLDGESAVKVESDEDKNDDDLENDGLIRMKKKTSTNSKASTSNPKAIANKKTTNGKNKAKATISEKAK